VQTRARSSRLVFSFFSAVRGTIDAMQFIWRGASGGGAEYQQRASGIGAMKEKVLIGQSVGFVTIIVLAWFNELVDLRSLILGDHPYISDFREATLEMLFVLVVWLLVTASTRRLLARLKTAENFLHMCGWCRRVRTKSGWLSLEKFLFQSHNTATSHGICEDCCRKQAALFEQENSRQASSVPGAEAPKPTAA
jgi:hypothetical protein